MISLGRTAEYWTLLATFFSLMFSPTPTLGFQNPPSRLPLPLFHSPWNLLKAPSLCPSRKADVPQWPLPLFAHYTFSLGDSIWIQGFSVVGIPPKSLTSSQLSPPVWMNGSNCWLIRLHPIRTQKQDALFSWPLHSSSYVPCLKNSSTIHPDSWAPLSLSPLLTRHM